MGRHRTTDEHDADSGSASCLGNGGPRRSTFARRVIDWQRVHGRHDLPWQRSRDPYAIWVSEVMLQQTQVTAVIPYYQRFMLRFPDVAALADAPADDVMRHWSGLGYYSRARNLHRAAMLVRDRHGGTFPRLAQEIAALPGVGRSTAAAIAALAYGSRGAILDGNVKRVLCRCFGIEGVTAVQKCVVMNTLTGTMFTGKLDNFTLPSNNPQ